MSTSEPDPTVIAAVNKSIDDVIDHLACAVAYAEVDREANLDVLDAKIDVVAKEIRDAVRAAFESRFSGQPSVSLEIYTVLSTYVAAELAARRLKAAAAKLGLNP